MLSFASDYMETCAPEILKRLGELGKEKLAGYGFDRISESARNKIREAAGAPEADVYFLIGGTQTNATGAATRAMAASVIPNAVNPAYIQPLIKSPPRYTAASMKAFDL